ncbi:MAG: DUF3795 domain-containing protein [Candidatus Thorarchaeota archaeon]
MSFNPCDARCEGCPSYLGKGEPPCAGCRESGERPWWGTCKVFDCTTEKSLNHCGLCDEFPSDLLIGHYDPDNPEGQRNAAVRAGVLAYLVRHGDDKALELYKKIKKA